MIFVAFTHFYGYKLSIVQNQVSAHPRVLLKVDAIDSTGIHLGSLRNLLGRHHLWARSGEIGLSFFLVQSGTMNREKIIIFSLPRNWCSLPGQKSNNKSTGPTYRSDGAGWTQLGAVCWQPTGRMGRVGCINCLLEPNLGNGRHYFVIHRVFIWLVNHQKKQSGFIFSSRDTFETVGFMFWMIRYKSCNVRNHSHFD